MQIFAEFDSHEALVREFQSNLAKARAFVVGSFAVTERERVEFVLIHPVTGEWLPLKAEVVYIAPTEQAAVGLEILEWTPERLALIQSFVESTSDEVISLVSPASIAHERFELAEATPHVTVSITSEPLRAAEPSLRPLDLSLPPGVPVYEESQHEGAAQEELLAEEVLTEDLALAAESDLAQGAEATSGELEEAAASEPLVNELSLDEGALPPDQSQELADWALEEAEGRSESTPPSSRLSQPPPKNVQERVRKLSMRERDAMARGGTLTERVALERAYGAVVWDGLLSNAALTGPEVARIAKNGNATIPHLTLIVNNPAWLAKGEVRRALLTNPRLTPPQIERVLRALPPAELKQLPKQTAYAPKVRAVAMKMLSR